MRVRAIVEGRVQGVFFRYTTCEEADKLGVNGWVMNRRDGNVELVAEGTQEAVGALIQWCHHGPPGARVMSVKTTNESYTGEFQSFDVRYSDSSRW
ncbi:MAG: acylphosphatase [Candidatus Abyssobacteria bacterium SURF_17]|uniref:Acylphosphatase n=1 Tax=Candidatus Abyssobacteria bacterium SURF_17 TaxID=2093361 RepID=A0A419ENI1_9BACT|nr:MAG: acylphosphatase [Candidatus Abyssubacteria bacterium SURF_17]